MHKTGYATACSCILPTSGTDRAFCPATASRGTPRDSYTMYNDSNPLFVNATKGNAIQLKITFQGIPSFVWPPPQKTNYHSFEGPSQETQPSLKGFAENPNERTTGQGCSEGVPPCPPFRKSFFFQSRTKTVDRLCMTKRCAHA